MKKRFLLLFFLLTFISNLISYPLTGDFNQQISERKMTAYDSLDKFGINPLITTLSTPEDVWEFGGEYPFSTTDDIISVSSDNASDTQLLSIQGLDINGYLVSQSVTLEGQTRVALTTPLWRVFRMENEGTTKFLGTVYCYSGTENTTGTPSGASVVKAMIDDGNNQTLMAVYTIPRGKVGFLKRGEVGIEAEGVPSANEFVTFAYQSRRYGKVFKIKKIVTCLTSGNSNYQDYRVIPDPIPSLTDIKICVKSVSTDIGTWATFDIILLDEGKLDKNYLKAIGQPGY